MGQRQHIMLDQDKFDKEFERIFLNIEHLEKHQDTKLLSSYFFKIWQEAMYSVVASQLF